MARSGRRPGPEAGLPVDPARLRRQFPDLSDGDLEAYVEVTRRILGQAGLPERARLSREILARARGVQGKAAGELTVDEALALRYLRAVEKMQGRTS